MLTAEEGAELLTYDRALAEAHRWGEREERPGWSSSTARWVTAGLTSEHATARASADDPAKRATPPHR